MEEDILNYLPTVMFRGYGTLCIKWKNKNFTVFPMLRKECFLASASLYLGKECEGTSGRRRLRSRLCVSVADRKCFRSRLCVSPPDLLRGSSPLKRL